MNSIYNRGLLLRSAIAVISAMVVLSFYHGRPAWADKPSPVTSGNAARVPNQKTGSPAAGRSSPAAKNVDSAYHVGIGDVLSISVWKDESLTRTVIVLPDGTISFPLIGQVGVDGMTLAKLKAFLAKKLDRYVPDVTLSVQVMQTGSQVIYIIGKVNRPGRFDLTNNINVLQALALAGGLNPFAKSKSIQIFRESRHTTHIFKFNYDEVAKGEDLQQNIRLERGDVIVVR